MTPAHRTARAPGEGAADSKRTQEKKHAMATKRSRRTNKLATTLSIGALALALAVPTAAFAGDVQINRNQSAGNDYFAVQQPQKQLAANLGLQKTEQDAESSNDADQRASISNYAPNKQIAEARSTSYNDVEVDAESKSSNYAASGRANSVGNVTLVDVYADQNAEANASGTARNNITTGNANVDVSGDNEANGGGTLVGNLQKGGAGGSPGVQRRGRRQRRRRRGRQRGLSAAAAATVSPRPTPRAATADRPWRWARRAAGGPAPARPLPAPPPPLAPPPGAPGPLPARSGPRRQRGRRGRRRVGPRGPVLPPAGPAARPPPA